MPLKTGFLCSEAVKLWPVIYAVLCEMLEELGTATIYKRFVTQTVIHKLLKK